MEYQGPEGCGNSPRAEIISEVTRAWAAGERHVIDEWLADTGEWTVHPAAAPTAFSALTVHNAINHGRFGSCHGTVELADGSAARIAGFFTFTSTAKTARIREALVIVARA